jgi:hypothetical protein
MHIYLEAAEVGMLTSVPKVNDPDLPKFGAAKLHDLGALAWLSLRSWI